MYRLRNLRGNVKLSINTTRRANKNDTKIGIKLLVHIKLVEELVVTNDYAYEMDGYKIS